jgi:hypothetical protein
MPLIFAATALVALLVYAGTTCVNMLYTDQYRIISQLIESLDGDYYSMLKFLWIEYAGHRAVFYHTLVFINYWLFNYNTLIESYLSCFMIIAALLVLQKQISAPSRDQSFMSRAVLITSHCVLTLLILSSIASGLIAWSIGVAIFAKSLVLICFCAYLANLIEKQNDIGTWDLIAVGIATLSLVLFLGGYIFGFLPACFLALTALYCAQRTRALLKIGACVALVAIAGIAIYKGQSAAAAATLPITEAPQVLLFVLIMFGNAILMNLEGVPINVYQLVGAVNLALILFCVAVSLKKQQTNFVGITLVFYAICVSIVIAIGRVEVFGPEYGLQPRYILETQLGMIGALILASQIRSEPVRICNGYRLLSIYTVIAALLLLGIVREMRIGPYRKSYMLNLVQSSRQLLFTSKVLSSEQIAAFNASSYEELKKALENCVVHGLSAFSCRETYGNSIYVSRKTAGLPLNDGLFPLEDSVVISFSANQALNVFLFEEGDGDNKALRAYPVWNSGRSCISSQSDQQISVQTLDSSDTWCKLRFVLSNPNADVGTRQLSLAVISTVGLRAVGE